MGFLTANSEYCYLERGLANIYINQYIIQIKHLHTSLSVAVLNTAIQNNNAIASVILCLYNSSINKVNIE